MRPGWIIGVIMAFVILSLIAGIAENAYYGAEATTKLDILMRPFMQSSLWGGIKTAMGSLFSTQFWDTLWAVFWWQYPFFDGSLSIVRYILFIPLSIGILFSLAIAIIRGVRG